MQEYGIKEGGSEGNIWRQQSRYVWAVALSAVQSPSEVAVSFVATVPIVSVV